MVVPGLIRTFSQLDIANTEIGGAILELNFDNLRKNSATSKLSVAKILELSTEISELIHQFHK